MSSILPLESSCVFIPSAQRPVMRCATSDSHWGTSSRTDPTAPTVNASLQTHTHTRRHKITIQVHFCTIFTSYIPKHSLCVCMCLCTRDVGVFLGVESQLVLCGQVDEGLHGGEVGDVSVADLTEQRLQVPAHAQTKYFISSGYIYLLPPFC